jgi:hypothetical protein
VNVPARDASELQDFAARFLLQNAFSLAGWPPPFLSQKEVDSESKPYLESAEALRAEARKLDLLRFCGSNLAIELLRVATACEGIAKRIKHPPYLIPVAPRPDQGDRRAYVLSMANVCQIAFGKSLYGTIARITTVVFGVELKPQEVRSTLRTA